MDGQGGEELMREGAAHDEESPQADGEDDEVDEARE